MKRTGVTAAAVVTLASVVVLGAAPDRARADDAPPAAGGGRARVPYTGPADKRLWKLYAGGGAVLLGATGAAFILIDGPRFTEDMGRRVRQPQRYATFVPGIVMASGAVALLGTAAALHYLEIRRGWGVPGTQAALVIAPVVPITAAGAGGGGGGLQAVVRW